jgi:hypothetical protein
MKRASASGKNVPLSTLLHAYKLPEKMHSILKSKSLPLLLLCSQTQKMIEMFY